MNQSAVTIFQQLRSILPGQTVNYLKRATSYVFAHNNLEGFVLGVIDGTLPQIVGYSPHPEVEEYLRREWNVLNLVLPDADEGYLSQIFQEFAGTTHLQNTISEAIASGFYPKRSPPQKEPVKEFDVEAYCRLIPDPGKSFSHANYIFNDALKKDAIQYLRKIFGDADGRITSSVEETRSLFLAYERLRHSSGNRNYEVPSTLRTTQPDYFVKPDYDQIFEKLYIEHESEIMSYLEQQTMVLSEEKKKGQLEVCPICLGEVVKSQFVNICPSGHTACVECLKKHTELLFFENRIFFNCMDHCDFFIPDSAVMMVWDSARFSQLLQLKSIRAKQDLGQLPCPTCNYPYKQSDSEQLECKNCGYKFCGMCKKKAHAPAPCNDYEDNICRGIEEIMTSELIRYCPNKSCKSPIIKEAGFCNKVQCVCGQYICYVCRKTVPGNDAYNHFYGQGVLPNEAKGLCPLYSDINSLHVHRVVKRGQAALEKLIEENPGLELSYDPLKVLPTTDVSDMPPGQY